MAAWIDFEEVAHVYEHGRGLELGALGDWRRALASYLPPASRLPVLDVGSGTGQFADAIAGWFDIDVVGVEPCQAMIVEAMARHTHPRVRYLCGHAEDLPLPDASCGAAWLSTVIHHLSDLRRAAAELARVLAADAPVLIRSAFPGRHEHITLFRFFPAAAAIAAQFPSVEQTVEAFAGAGFRMQRLEGVAQLTAPNLAALRERVRDRADTTLRLLDDDDFASGLRALDAAIEAGGKAASAAVIDRLDLLVLVRAGKIH